MPDGKSHPARPIGLTDTAIEGIQDLIENSSIIATISERAANQSAAASILGLATKISAATDLPRRKVYDVLTGLWNIYRLWPGAKGSDVVLAITESLTNDAAEEWLAEWLDRWKTCSPEVAGAIDLLHDDHPIFVSQKAQSLAYSQQNIFMSARLITDVRPVFDAAGEKILETAIIHTLSIVFSTGHHEPSVMSFAMDADDIAELKKACLRAEGKIRATVNALSGLNPVVFPEGRG